MQIALDQLAGRLAQRLHALYVLHGDEPLLVQEAADAVRAAARAAGHAERQVFTASGAHFDWSGVLGAAQAQSLFAERRMIEIRIPSGKPGTAGSQALQAYAAAAPEDVLTLVLLPRLDRQQQSSAWFAALDGAGVSVRIDGIGREQLPAWLAQRLALQKQQVRAGDEGRRTLAFFADRVEGNLLAAHQELQKLALLHPPGELGFEEVEAAVLNVARYDVFKLGEAVWGGQVARALRMLDGLKSEGETPVLVHWTLADDIRQLARLKAETAAGKPLPLALREARVFGAKERLFEAALPRYESASLERLLHAASICDGLVKGLRHPQWPQDAWQALRRLLLMAMQPLVDARATRGDAGRPRAPLVPDAR